MTSMTVLGGICGLLVAAAVLLFVSVAARPGRGAGRRPRMSPWLRSAGLERITPMAFAAGSVAAGLVGAMVGAALTGLPSAALLAGVLAALTPTLVVRHRARAARARMRECWPEAVDAMVSAVRAGLSLPEAVAGLAATGPADLRPLFSVVGAEYRATGSFDAALDLLRDRSGEPIADRVVVALRLSRDWGGTQVGEVLRTLSTMVREDSRIRSEIRGRQSWTVSAARLAVAAPWLTLLLLSTRSDTVAAFATPAGGLLLAGAALASAVAYAAMTRISRLPDMSRLAP